MKAALLTSVFGSVSTLALGGLMIVGPRPAMAFLNTVTAKQLGNPGAVVPCPTNVSFEADIQGNGGEPFGWLLSYTLGGVMHEAPPGTTTAVIDATGHYKINVTISVPNGTSPGDTFQFKTQNLDSPQRNLYTQAMPFTVSCAANPAGLLTPSGVSQQISNNINQDILFAKSAPTNVRIITAFNDPKCDFNCATEDMPKGKLPITFDYADPKYVDGYHLYGFGIITPLTSTTTYFAVPPIGDFAGKCYHVTAFKGTAESAASTEVCASSSSSEKTVDIFPKYDRTDTFQDGGAVFDVMGAANVGIDRKMYDPTRRYDDSNSKLYRSGFYFDTSTIGPGHKIENATLILHSYQSSAPGGQCGTRIVEAQNQWWVGDPSTMSIKPGEAIDISPLIPDKDQRVGIEPVAPNPARVDITDFVSGWVNNNRSNFGIIVEQLGDLASGGFDYCYSSFDTAQLHVIYR